MFLKKMHKNKSQIKANVKNKICYYDTRMIDYTEREK